ncbi:hypothetical protein [Streptomyces brevispora]|uniref:Uncharacterized protein n=1 Tax=Streptomyces brevispora TaxID=887462 RepID=A0A561TXW9_9ACTN|nr:hypothetical protein FHX80_12280 [Streptomyces brevispora]
MPKAYVFTRNGGPEAEAFVKQDAPVPGAGEPLVAVRAAGAKPVDRKRRTGYTRPGSEPQPFPTVLSSEAAADVAVFGLVGGGTLKDARGQTVTEVTA